MSNTIDFYKTLQVHPEAGQEIIDAAYRCLSKKYHPDINRSPMATEHMKEINIAYSVVGDSRKRKQYHFERSRQNSVGKPTASPFSSAPTPKPEKKEEKPPHKKEETLAEKVLDAFFKNTVHENWNEAYAELTKLDAQNIPLEDFVEWKNAVTRIYKLGDYKISYFRRYENCEYAGKIYPVILQFAVSIKEMHVVTSQVSEETTQKYVAFDGQEWRVCLGYKDLKPNILKFKYLAQSLPKLDKEEVFLKAIDKIDLLTGTYSLNGFVEQAEREILRSKRYGNPLSMAVIGIEPSQNEEMENEASNLTACISYFTETLCNNMRRTDVIGRCGENAIALLFTETKLSEAKKALAKLLELCESEEYLNYAILSNCISLTKEDVKKSIFLALEKATLREKSTGEPGVEGKRKEQSKLGKYQAADILGFNKKGRNHF